MSNDTDRDAGARETVRGWTIARRAELVKYLARQAVALTRPKGVVLESTDEHMYEAGKRYAFCENLLNAALGYRLGEDPAGIVTRLQARADRLWSVAHERGELDRFDTGEVTVLGIYIPIIRDMVQEWAVEDMREEWASGDTPPEAASKAEPVGPEDADCPRCLVCGRWLEDHPDTEEGEELDHFYTTRTSTLDAVEAARTEALENGPTVGSPYA